MYFSFVKTTRKNPKPPENKFSGGQDPILMNPKLTVERKVRRGETVYEPIIEGEAFTREPILTAHKLLLCHSYRHEGKVKKKQVYLCTIPHDEIINYYQNPVWIGRESHELRPSHGIIEFEDKILQSFPDVDIYALSKDFEKMFMEFFFPMISEQMQSEEYQYFLIHEALKDEGEEKAKHEQRKCRARKKRREAKKAKQEEEESIKTDEYIKEQMGEHFYNQYKEQEQEREREAMQGILEATLFYITGVEAEFLIRYYKKISTLVHPDKGGDIEDMKLLNGMIANLKNQVKAI